MTRITILCIFFFITVTSFAQKDITSQATTSIERPKLVVGVVIDQMRWDFLYRYYDRYSSTGAFKRMLNQGFSCENTFIPYAPTVTACGHSSIYTGSVPNINGITGNAWWDNNLNRAVYCTEDNTVGSVGSKSSAGKMSPRNMLATTIGDELRLSNNFQSKVIGISPKDRGAILPAGHSANAAYWFDASVGNWITSTYYMNDLPAWMNSFNDRKMSDGYYAKGWETLYPVDTYKQSAKDLNDYEAKPFGADQKGFPYDLKKFAGTNYSAITSTPFSATMTLELSKAAIEGEKLGSGAVTDFLAVSISSTDYIGHAFGPNSIETEDAYLRLDKDLGAFMDYLDTKIGKGKYLMFLSADHGVAHVPGFMKENKLPGGTFNDGKMLDEMAGIFKAKYGFANFINVTYNYQVSLNNKAIDSMKLNKKDIEKDIISYLGKQNEIAEVFALDDLMQTPMNEKKRKMLANGYFPSRGGDIQIVLKPGFIEGMAVGTTHGLWNPYDSHIPLLWYGWNIKPGKSNREIYMTDIAATVAALLHIQMPSGCVGNVIEEITK